MAKEIEMKFLVANDKWKKMPLLKKVDIEQGYLVKSRAQTIRVRVTNDAAFLTVKGALKNLTRDEFEYEIPHADGVELLRMCATPHVRKTRHYLRDDKNQIWEIDIFKGINRGLTMAEIELEDEKQAKTLVLPEWIGTDVSHDRRYTNAYLADHKVPRR